jgi:hypothetical protein
MTTIANMPEGPMRLIFIHIMVTNPTTFLTVVVRVCKEWANLCRETIILKLQGAWLARGRTRSSFESGSGMLLRACMRETRRFRFVGAINVYSVTGLVMTTLHPSAGTHLKSLQMKHLNPVPAGVLQSVAATCKALTSISLSFAQNYVSAPSIIRNLAKGCPSLVTLNVEDCLSFMEIDYIAISGAWPNLTTLTLHNVFDRAGNCIRALKGSWPKLTSLSFAGCNIHNDQLQFIARNWPRLRNFSFVGCGRLGQIEIDRSWWPGLITLTVPYGRSSVAVFKEHHPHCVVRYAT